MLVGPVEITELVASDVDIQSSRCVVMIWTLERSFVVTSCKLIDNLRIVASQGGLPKNFSSSRVVPKTSVALLRRPTLKITVPPSLEGGNMIAKKKDRIEYAWIGGSVGAGVVGVGVEGTEKRQKLLTMDCQK